MNDDIILMLRPFTDELEEHLEYIPYRRFLNMIVMYMVIREAPCAGGTEKVELHTLDKLEARMRGIRTEEELYEIALKNTERRFPPRITDLSDGIFCVTNQHNVFGAAAILYKNELKALSKYAGTNIYIVPVSIHEVICIKQDAADPEDIYELIRRVNTDIVEEDDYLSESIYYYDSDADKLVIAYSEDGYYM